MNVTGPKIRIVPRPPLRAAVETQRDLQRRLNVAVTAQAKFFTQVAHGFLAEARGAFAMRFPQAMRVPESSRRHAARESHITQLAEIFVAARILGRARARREAGMEVSARGGRVETFREELRGIGVKNAVEHIKGLRVVTREEWNRLTAAQRARAFSVAGIEERAALEGLQKLIAEGIDKGWTEQQFAERAEKLLGKFQQEAGALRTLWNTTVGSSLAKGREEELNDPEVKRVVSWRLFDAMLDFATRPNHRALDGGLAPADWPGWIRYAPLLGYNCRCTLVGVTASWARELLGRGRPYFDLTQDVPALAGPDPGFAKAA